MEKPRTAFFLMARSKLTLKINIAWYPSKLEKMKGNIISRGIRSSVGSGAITF